MRDENSSLLGTCSSLGLHLVFGGVRKNSRVSAGIGLRVLTL